MIENDEMNVSPMSEELRRERTHLSLDEGETAQVPEPESADLVGSMTRAVGRRYQLAEIALSQNFAVMAGVSTRAATPPLKRFGKQVWFSPHHDSKFYQRPFSTIKDDERGELYVVLSSMEEHLAGETSVKYMVPCISRQGAIALWPIGLPVANGQINTWNQSAWNAVLSSQRQWIRLTADIEAGGYRRSVPSQEWEPPVWPENLDDLVEEAINTKLIATKDHSLIQRLQGAY
jgi:hypothetical protein